MALKPNNVGMGDQPDRDPELDRVYALGGREEPPARLDDAIRAAARREVRARPRLIGALLHSWRMPVSIAAVLVLSASLVMLMKEDGADRFDEGAPPAAPQPAAGRAQPDAPRSQPAPAPEGAPPERVVTPPSSAAAIPEAGMRRERAATEARDDLPRQRARTPSTASVEERRPAASPTQAAPPAQSQERAAVLNEAHRGPAAAGTMSDRAAPFVTSPPAGPAVPGDQVAKRTEPGVGPGASPESPAGLRSQAPQAKAAAPLARPMAAPSRPQAGAAPTVAESGAGALASPPAIWAGYDRQPPEKWIEKIEELRRSGQEAEAREMLEEFKRRFPGHPLPAALAR